jgi:hypothetical protein
MMKLLLAFAVSGLLFLCAIFSTLVYFRLVSVAKAIVMSPVPRRRATVSATWIAKAGGDHWALSDSTPSVVVAGEAFEAVDSDANRLLA